MQQRKVCFEAAKQEQALLDQAVLVFAMNYWFHCKDLEERQKVSQKGGNRTIIVNMHAVICIERSWNFLSHEKKKKQKLFVFLRDT